MEAWKRLIRFLAPGCYANSFVLNAPSYLCVYGGGVAFFATLFLSEIFFLPVYCAANIGGCGLAATCGV